MENKEHTLSILVENTPGVLSQVSRLFSRKGYNIDSIASGATEDPKVTRITIVMNGDDATIEQLAAQLRKLLCVISVKVLSTEDAVQRELVLVKVRARWSAPASSPSSGACAPSTRTPRSPANSTTERTFCDPDFFLRLYHSYHSFPHCCGILFIT